MLIFNNKQTLIEWIPNYRKKSAFLDLLVHLIKKNHCFAVLLIYHVA